MYRLLAVPAVLMLAGCSFATKKTVVEPGPVATHVTSGSATSIDWAAVYAPDRPQIAVACPQDTPSDIEQALGRPWHEDYRLAMGESTQVVFSTVDGTTHVEVIDRSVVDLCPREDAPRQYRLEDRTPLDAVTTGGERRLQVAEAAA